MNDYILSGFGVVSATDYYGLIEIGFGEHRIAPPAEIQGILLVFMAKPLKEAFNLMPLKKNLLPPAEAILGCPQPAIFIDEAINAKMRDQELAWIIKEFAMVHLMTIMSLH